jgi:3-oxoadipate enol-lactonase
VSRAEHRYVTLDCGVRLHYRIQGNPKGPWIVLLNGLLSDTTMWAGTLPGLTPSFHVLTFDGRGQGRSDAPNGGAYPVGLMAEDAWELFGKLSLERPWLVGLSNGANISLELLAAHPGAFSGAVLTSSVPCIDFTTRLRVLHWIQCLQVGGPLMQFDAVAPYLWGDRFLTQRHGVLRAYHQVVTEGRGSRRETSGGEDPFQGATRQMEGILDWDIRERLGAIVDPILFLSGAEDLLTPPWKCLETAQRVGHARFEVVPGVGHAFPVEEPKAFSSRVTEFIDHVSNHSGTRG